MNDQKFITPLDDFLSYMESSLSPKDFAELKSKIQTKLLDRAIEIDKIDAETQTNANNREIETNIELKKIANDRKDRIIKNCLTAASIVCTAGITVWGSLKSWKFEETGVITSGPGREFMRRIFHSMK